MTSSGNTDPAGGAGCDWIRRASAIRRIVGRTIPDIANARVTQWKRLRHAEHYRSTRFQRTSVGFVPRTVLEEDAVTAANRGLAVTPWIPGKANSWRRIEQMSLHAAGGRAARAALHQPKIVHELLEPIGTCWD